MKAVHDFNYKVALASGLRHLQTGKLRQAEEQFRYLVSKFPRADGGYRGLARVQVEAGDRAGALATLRDGAAVLARTGDRAVAIDLLREATTLDPVDLAAHRRLAAALSLAGDGGSAAQEYVRFVKAELASGDDDRARLEASYAVETLGEIPALRELALSLGLPLRIVRRELPAPRETFAPDETREEEPSAPSAAPDRLAAWMPPAAPAPAPWVAPRSETAPPVAAPEAAAASRSPAAPIDPVELEERALALIAARDASAGAVAIQAARALLAGGKVNAASDLLLQLVASGIAVHEAQRALIDVARAMGRSDVADERQRLLAEAQRLG